MSPKPVAERLRMLLDKELNPDENVGFSPDCVGPEAVEMAGQLEKGQTLLLENLRFHPEEEANGEKFSKQLASLADFYVNDAFGTAHRAHASTVGVTKFLKKSAAGLLMEKELEYLGKVSRSPNGLSLRSWAAPRSATRSASSATCWTKLMSLSSVAEWPIPS